MVLAQIPYFQYSPGSYLFRYSPGCYLPGTRPDPTFLVLAQIPPFRHSLGFHLFFRYSPRSNIFRCLPRPFSEVCPGILIFSGIASGCHYLFRHYLQITHLPRHRDLFSLSPLIGATLFRYPSILDKGTKLFVIWVLH